MIKIKIKTDNEAFGESEEDSAVEVARILREIASELTRGNTPLSANDINGNKVCIIDYTADYLEDLKW